MLWVSGGAVTKLIATMNFTGKYQQQSQENFEAFMKAAGECWTGRQVVGYGKEA